MNAVLELPDDLIDAIATSVLERLAAQPAARFVSREKLAELLGVEPRTVKTWRSKGLPGVRVGREVMYDLEAVNRWIEANG